MGIRSLLRQAAKDNACRCRRQVPRPQLSNMDNYETGNIFIERARKLRATLNSNFCGFTKEHVLAKCYVATILTFPTEGNPIVISLTENYLIDKTQSSSSSASLSETAFNVNPRRSINSGPHFGLHCQRVQVIADIPKTLWSLFANHPTLKSYNLLVKSLSGGTFSSSKTDEVTLKPGMREVLAIKRGVRDVVKERFISYEVTPLDSLTGQPDEELPFRNSIFLVPTSMAVNVTRCNGGLTIASNVQIDGNLKKGEYSGEGFEGGTLSGGAVTHVPCKQMKTGRTVCEVVWSQESISDVKKIKIPAPEKKQ